MTDNSKALARITAFWALCESGLGGLLHAIQLPFKGAVLCFLSLLCLSMISKWSDDPRKAIGKSLIIVLLIKAVVSPHSPITAYMAVTFQAMMASVLFYRGYNQAGLLFVALLSFVESALQRVLTLWLFFGVSFWEALNDLGGKIAPWFGYDTGGPEVVIGIYTSLYALMAVASWWWIPKILAAIEKERGSIKIPTTSETSSAIQPKKKGGSKWGILLSVGGALVLYFAWKEGWQSGLYVALRSVIVIFLWFKYLAPWMSKWFVSLLKKQEVRLSGEIEESLAFFPKMTTIMNHYWEEKKRERYGWSTFLSRSISDIIWNHEKG